MPSESLMRDLRTRNYNRWIQMQMVWESAPVLKNVKVSSMFAVPAGYSKMLCSLLFKTGISIVVLNRTNNRELVLVYRRNALRSYYETESAQTFLKKYGYEGKNLQEALQLLQNRISYYQNKQQEFPHETGVFLGYPVKDVEGFIRNAGADSCLTGYWKVYSDVEHAKRQFRAYDRAKEVAVEEFFSGKNLREIAC